LKLSPAISQIKLQEKTIFYKPIISKKAKYLRLQINTTGELEVIIPYRSNQKEAEKFILKKINWINKHLAKSPAEIKPLLFGNEIKIKQHFDLFCVKHKFIFRNKELFITSPSGSVESLTYLYNIWLKHAAKKYISERVKHLSERTGFICSRISIRGQKTRWGSCSTKGRLSFNFKLIRYRKEVIDYVILHELCHLKEMNHSKRFWMLVEKFCPDYENLKRELKRNG
jgi:predicted metal-dependent hydrolase